MDLKNIKALAFDVGGTVLDWYTGITRDLKAWGEGRGMEEDWPAFAEEWRKRALEMTLDSEKADLPRGNIDGVHRYVLDSLLAERGMADVGEAEREAMTLFWHRLPPWPDAPSGHARLKKRYILSTITILSVRMVIDVSRLAPFHWDSVISCEMFDRYKFHPSVYQRAADLIALEPQEIIFVAAHNLDLQAAGNVGFRTALVARPDEWGKGKDTEGTPDHVDLKNFEIDFTARDMEDLAEQLGA